MMIRHSPIFWLGFFPIVVILWAWADSQRFQTSWITRRNPECVTILEVSRAALQFRKQEAVRMSEAEAGSAMSKLYEHVPPFAPIGALGVIERRGYLRTAVIPPFPSPARIDEKQIASVWHFTTTGIRLPLWLLLSGFLPVWLALTWWDVRRRTKRRDA